MTDALNEQLSALLDGELPEAEAELCLKRLERQAELRGTLGRYALIGEALRATAPVAAARPDFPARVTAALDERPATAGRGGWSWWRPAAGLGVAAAVGAFALLLVGRGTPPAPLAAMPAASPVAAPVLATRVAAPAATRVPSMGDLLAHRDPLRLAGNGEPASSYVTPLPSRSAVPVRPASEFANYVVAHAEYVSPLGRRAVLSGLVAGDGGPSSGEFPASVAAAEPLFPAAPADRDRR